jgi:hypothetical protein
MIAKRIARVDYQSIVRTWWLTEALSHGILAPLDWAEHHKSYRGHSLGLKGGSLQELANSHLDSKCKFLHE